MGVAARYAYGWMDDCFWLKVESRTITWRQVSDRRFFGVWVLCEGGTLLDSGQHEKAGSGPDRRQLSLLGESCVGCKCLGRRLEGVSESGPVNRMDADSFSRRLSSNARGVVQGPHRRFESFNRDAEKEKKRLWKMR